MSQLAVLALKLFETICGRDRNTRSLATLDFSFLTQSFKVWAEQPILADIDMIACQRVPCWASLSSTSLTARSRTSGENLFVVLLMMLHPTQKLEPPANPVRFSGILTKGGCHYAQSLFLGIMPLRSS